MAKIVKNNIFSETQDLWKVITKGNISEEENLKHDLEIHKKLLNIFQVGGFYYLIVNVFEGKFDYVSPQIKDILGIESETVSLEDFLELIHPEDQPYFLNFEKEVSHFFSQLPIDKINRYKVRYDYRVRKSNGEYIRILQQGISLEHDDDGAVLRTLVVHTDISDLKENTKPILSLIGLEGEPSYTNIEVEHEYIVSSFLTQREKEIISLLSNGNSSKEIAVELCISPFTVETHRKNLLSKTNTKNVGQLIAKAIREGWV